jgi:hypothetical protein
MSVQVGLSKEEIRGGVPGQRPTAGLTKWADQPGQVFAFNEALKPALFFALVTPLGGVTHPAALQRREQRRLRAVSAAYPRSAPSAPRAVTPQSGVTRAKLRDASTTTETEST